MTGVPVQAITFIPPEARICQRKACLAAIDHILNKGSYSLVTSPITSPGEKFDAMNPFSFLAHGCYTFVTSPMDLLSEKSFTIDHLWNYGSYASPYDSPRENVAIISAKCTLGTCSHRMEVFLQIALVFTNAVMFTKKWMSIFTFIEFVSPIQSHSVLHWLRVCSCRDTKKRVDPFHYRNRFPLFERDESP